MTEKERWRERISQHLDRRADAATAAADPHLLERVQAAARGQALASLGLADLHALGYDVRMVTWRGLRPIPRPAPERMNLWASARGAG